MKYFFSLVTSLFCIITTANANINAIDFSQVHLDQQGQSLIIFLQKNVSRYDHWVHEWNYDIKKDAVSGNLVSLYEDLNKLSSKNEEVFLLMGDISHYLYNIEVDAYYDKAVSNYNLAIQTAPVDYRGYWFLANHYSLSNSSLKAIENFNKALSLSKDLNGYFWSDYSFAAYTAGMPSTAKYAVEKSVKAFGETDSRNNFFIKQLKGVFKQPRADTAIAIKDMWSMVGKQGNKVILVNRVVGIRLAIDSTWGIQLMDFDKQGEGIPIQPHTIVSKKNGRAIGYSILVLPKVAQPGQSLSDFMALFIKNSDTKKPATLTDKYKNAIAYEILAPEVYKDIGGGHMYMMAIERGEPAYPGMALEQAGNELSKGEQGKVNYYNVNPKFTRLKGKLYYLVLLDTCGYIHDESLAVFKDFLENGLVIE